MSRNIRRTNSLISVFRAVLTRNTLDISIRISTRKTEPFVFLVLMLMLISSALLVKQHKTNKWIRSSYVSACAQARHELMQIIFGLQLAGFKCLNALSVSSVTWMSLIFIMLRSYRMEICPTDVKYSVVKAHQKTVPRTGNFSSRYPHSWTRCECLFALFLSDKASFSKTKASRIFLHELSARCTPLANKRVLVRTGSLWEQLKTQRSNNVHKETKGNKKTSV